MRNPKAQVVQKTIAQALKKKPAKKVRMEVKCPVEFVQRIQEFGKDLPTNSSEKIKPLESAVALWRLAQGIPLKRIQAETGISPRAIREMAIRHRHTLNDHKEKFAALYAQAASEYSELLFEKADRMRENPEQLDQISPDRLAITVGIMTDQAAKLSGMASTVIEHRTGASIEDAAAMIAAARARIAEKAKAHAIEAEVIEDNDHA